MPTLSALWGRSLGLSALLAVPGGLPLQGFPMPAVLPPAAAAFSTSPSDAEIENARILELPLIPAGGATTPDENRELAGALLAYARSPSLENLAPLTGFLDRHPASPWKALSGVN